MEEVPDKSAILYVERSSSFCGECGQETLITERHEKVAGYLAANTPGGIPGCGVRFVAVTPLFASKPRGEWDLEEMQAILHETEVRLP